MLHHVIDSAQRLNPNKLVVVYGHGGDQVRSIVEQNYSESGIIWALQAEQLGTGHALKCALPHLDNDGLTLVLYGDVPLIELSTLEKMIAKYQDNVVMLTDEVENPTGYGRVVRNPEFRITNIVEEKDASQSERAIREINTGFYVLPNRHLADWLVNYPIIIIQGEYYLTDVIALSA